MDNIIDNSNNISAKSKDTSASDTMRKAPVDVLIDGTSLGGVFVESVSSITADEMGDARKQKSLTFGKIISFIFEKLLLIFAVCVFMYSAVELVQIFVEQNAGDKYYEELMDKYSLSINLDNESGGAVIMAQMKQSEAFVAGVSQPDSGIVIEQEEYNEEVELMKAKLASLMRVYPDVYAYIVIEDTVIDYPVVRGEDNDFYLNHAFTGEPLSIGSVFADYRLKDYILDNYNTVFYAHNSSTGKMFADIVKKFSKSEEFFNTHNIYVYTSTGRYIFEPFNLAVLSYDYPYFRTYFANGAAFVDFAYEMQSHSMYSKKLTFDENDRIITLSTCTDLGIKTMRYCLQGKLIEVTE